MAARRVSVSQRVPLRPFASKAWTCGSEVTMGRKFFKAAHHGEGHEQPHRHEGHELDDGFNRDGEDHAVLMLGGVDVAGAEEDGKKAHGDGHQNGQAIGALHDRHDGFGKQRIGDHGLQGLRHGLQLDRDIGHHANGRYRRDKGAQRLALAIAGREEVGDGGDVLAFGDFGNALQKRPAKGKNQDRPDVDRQEIKARARGDADTAEIGPGGAIDAKRQGIDKGAGRAGFSPVGGPVTPGCNGKEGARDRPVQRR